MLRAFLPLLITGLLVTGCGKTDSTPTASAGGSKGPVPQIFHVGNGAEPQDLDPQAITGVPEHKLMMALFEGLASEDPQDLHPVPAIAESWDISADGKTYTFHLRADAKWSNGEVITADDFLQSYKRMLTPAFASEYAYLIFNFVVGAQEYYKGQLKDFSQVGFKSPDPRTLVVSLKNATPYLMKIIASHYAWTPVPVKTIAKHGAIDAKRSPWT
ncbi:MAG: ABC transporter substrate-binding protein, partial [Opitutaceae bacterium]